jgi:hypothetical protein
MKTNQSNKNNYNDFAGSLEKFFTEYLAVEKTGKQTHNPFIQRYFHSLVGLYEECTEQTGRQAWVYRFQSRVDTGLSQMAARTEALFVRDKKSTYGSH